MLQIPVSFYSLAICLLWVHCSSEFLFRSLAFYTGISDGLPFLYIYSQIFLTLFHLILHLVFLK